MVHESEPCSEARAALERDDSKTWSDSASGGNALGGGNPVVGHGCREALDGGAFLVEPMAGQQRLHLRLGEECRGEHDIAAFAAPLQARGEVDRAAEIVEALVEGDDDAGALMQPQLDDDVPAS